MLKPSFLVFYNHFTCQLGPSVQLEQEGGAGEQGKRGELWSGAGGLHPETWLLINFYQLRRFIFGVCQQFVTV